MLVAEAVKTSIATLRQMKGSLQKVKQNQWLRRFLYGMQIQYSKQQVLNPVANSLKKLAILVWSWY